ncbi:MAG: hypothetical protein E6G94_14620 [Alphaproteobacteria bacterium]|nr:MAG: hypothetical protein E6G94_14620 [Alphaproteobacteria bacterium]
MPTAGLKRLLLAPSLSGKMALLCGAAAIGFPTLVRAAVAGEVTGCEFTPYLPFVLASAILVRWWQAAIVALSAVGILGGFFGGPLLYHLTCFLVAAGIFLASSAMVILIAVLIRQLVAALHDRGDGGEIVFSLEAGEVWASWYDDGAPVRLGPKHKVAPTMQKFLAEDELGKRLTKR